MRKPHTERRREVLAATLALVAERGVSGTSVQAIADRVGIAQPTVFRHFPDRDSLFSAAIADTGDALFAELTPVLAATDRPADARLHAFLCTQLAFVGRNPGLPRMLFSDRLHLESPDLKRAIQHIMEGLAAHLTDLVRAGQSEGACDPGIPPETAARQIIALVQGTVVRWFVFDEAAPDATTATALWPFIARGIGARRTPPETAP